MPNIAQILPWSMTQTDRRTDGRIVASLNAPIPSVARGAYNKDNLKRSQKFTADDGYC